MRNRKTLVMAFLLASVMLLSVGYAALTDTLDINGTADVSQAAADDAFNTDIVFTSAVPENEEGPDVASIVEGDPDMASFTVASLSGKGDKATFIFTIANNGDVDAVVTPTLAEDGNSNTNYFSVYSDWNGLPKNLPAGETVTYKLTVELLATPTEPVHGAFHIELTATNGTLEDAGEGEGE